MKKLLKSIIAAMLVAIIAISGISTETAQAASNPVIKVTYNKKTVKFTLIDSGVKGVKEVKYNSLKKKWGKPSETSKDEYCKTYTWRKGDTWLFYGDSGDKWTNYSINIYDKKTSLCGIKVGTKTDKAEKILENLGGEIEKSDNFVCAKYLDGRCTITYNFKNGKVTNMGAVLYVHVNE